MSTNESANQSATESTTPAESTNQSESVNTETTANENSEANQSEEFDLGKYIDDDWGLPQEEPQEPQEEKPDATTEKPEENKENQEEAKEPSETTEEEKPETTESESAEEKPATLRVNYLGKTYDLPEDEARKYAQIGMNSGRLQEKYDTLKPLEKLKDAVEVMALFRNQDPQRLIDEIASMENMRKTEIQALVDGGTDETVAAELFDSKIKEARQNHELAKMKRGQNPGLTESQKEDIKNFARVYPKEHENISAGKPIPEDVLGMWKSGTPLVAAWTIHENNEISGKYKELNKQINDLKKERDALKKENTNIRKNEENKKKAPTSKTGTGGGPGHIDIFAGWDKY